MFPAPVHFICYMGSTPPPTTNELSCPDRNAFLGLSIANMDQKHSASIWDGKMMILLQGTPARALLVDEIIGIDQPDEFTLPPKPTLAASCVQNFYTYKVHNDMVMELNRLSIAAHMAISKSQTEH